MLRCCCCCFFLLLIVLHLHFGQGNFQGRLSVVGKRSDYRVTHLWWHYPCIRGLLGKFLENQSPLVIFLLLLLTYALINFLRMSPCNLHRVSHGYSYPHGFHIVHIPACALWMCPNTYFVSGCFKIAWVWSQSGHTACRKTIPPLERL